MPNVWTLLAETTQEQTAYGLGRLQAYTERWQFLVLAVACAAIAVFVGVLYRRDSVELRRPVGWLLAALRIAAFGGLLIYYLGVEKKTQQKVIHNSRVLVLLDTSLSMGIIDSDTSASSGGLNRLQQALATLSDGGLLTKLRQTHELVLLRFDADTSRVAALDKLPPADGAADKTQPQPVPDNGDWKKYVLPQGPETRLSQALRQLINDERANPVAGIVIFSDGGQNAGMDPPAAIDAARDAKIPIYTVGLGSDRRPANVRVSDLVAPARAYPGDSFTITGYLQAQELADRIVSVELLSSAPGAAGAGEQEEGTQRITLAGRGEVVPVKFDITPQESGRRTYRLRVKAPPEDTDAADNQQEVDIEIVEHKTKVLLVAGGPARDYIFLRNQLRRDKSVVVDVLLQSAVPPEGISQDANEILKEFPDTAQQLYEYDCIVGFDPDWLALSTDQIDLLEHWVGERAGGLILIAGPVHTAACAVEARLSKIRSLYPVEFTRRLTSLADGRYGSTTAWPITFSREGLEAEFLWLADSGPSSQKIWSEFPGVYGYYEVKGAKPGATVFGRYSNPEAASGGEMPVYMAGQFYGSGRVFYLGSGEMWRLRAQSDGYFEQIYTKLIRHVSQGRLLVGSSRGMLLTDRDRYLVGNTVMVRAQLSDAQFEPLAAGAVPLQVVRPDGAVETLELTADAQRKGMFAGQFTALAQGAYHLEMAVPDSENEQLSRRVQVKVPELERENPQRNDALLKLLAEQTGGKYYIGADTVLGGRGQPALADQLKDRTKKTDLPGVKDHEFDRVWMQGLLGFIAGALCLEWLVRRLARLA